jgi:hypothetical protein
VLLRRLSASISLGAVLLACSMAHAAGPTKDECINANEAAQSARDAGKLRDAKAKLSVCVAKSCPATIRDDCAERLNEVMKALPSMVFDVHDAAGVDVTAVRVKMDGTVLSMQLDGTSIPVDPGQHTFSFDADGFAPLDVHVLVREAEKSRHEAVALRAAGEQTPATEPPDGATPPPDQSSTTDSKRPIRIGAYSAFGVGVVGVAMGTIFGAMALSDKSSLNSHCNAGVCPSAEQSDLSSLRSNGTVSDIGFVLGVGGLAAGTVMFLLSRKGEATPSAAPAVSWIGIGRAGIEGRF